MKSSLFIPKTIKVGYQNRADTYTGKLAYVIYYDEQGKLRKETSWNNWRDEKIPDNEFENEPTEGFVLNKKVGGYQYHYDMRQTYVRVYDPRGFEFEITIPNLLYILENANSIKGKGLEGEFVYSWDGKDIVLLPVDSPDYKELSELNKKRFSGSYIKAKDLKIGATYLNKNNIEVVYMGRFPYYDYYGTNKGNHYWFESVDKSVHIDRYSNRKVCKSIPKGWLIDVISEKPMADYSTRYESLESDYNFSPIDRSKDKYVPLTLEEFKELCNHHSWLVNCYTCQDNKYFDISFTQRGTVWEFSLYRNAYKLKNVDYGKAYTLDEIYELIHPCYKETYLENGKLLRREYYDYG